MISRASDFHKVTSRQEYRALVEKAMAKRRAHGFSDARVIEVQDPVAAYINHGRWVIDCDCGAGNMVEPEWHMAACLGCGAVRYNIILPSEEDRAKIEEVLNIRPRFVNRNWNPGETIEKLKFENIEHKLGKGSL